MRRHRYLLVAAIAAIAALVAIAACAPAEADGLRSDGSYPTAQDVEPVEAEVEGEVVVDDPVVGVDALHDHEEASTEALPEGDHHDGRDTSDARNVATDDGCPGHQVDVNDASPGDLERIVHIGSARAEQLEDLRPFSDVRDLTRIPGIGERRLLDIIEQGLACTS